MTSWSDFAQQAPDLAAFGRDRFATGVAYLATLRPDGGPRVHPVTPIVGEQLYLFMEPASPKGKDLQRDPRFQLHCAVADMSGGAGEFYVRGTAALTTDPVHRAAATQAAAYTPRADYLLFVLSLDFAFSNEYAEDGAQTRRWTAQG